MTIFGDERFDDVSTKSIVMSSLNLIYWLYKSPVIWAAMDVGRPYLGDERYFMDKDEFFMHLLYDKLWGLPRRVFTLFCITI